MVFGISKGGRSIEFDDITYRGGPRERMGLAASVAQLVLDGSQTPHPIKCTYSRGLDKWLLADSEWSLFGWCLLGPRCRGKLLVNWVMSILRGDEMSPQREYRPAPLVARPETSREIEQLGGYILSLGRLVSNKNRTIRERVDSAQILTDVLVAAIPRIKVPLLNSEEPT